MKSIAKLFIIGLQIFVCVGFVSAQSAASNSRDIAPSAQVVPSTTAPTTPPAQVIMDTLPDRGIPTPPHIEKLLQESKVEQALSEFEKFKSGLKKASPFQLLFLEMTIYEQAQSFDPSNTKYAAKIKALKQEIIENFPNEPDSYLLQIENNTPPELVIELATKAIQVDSKFTEAYSQRGRALYKLGQTKEACADFEKVPWKDMLPEYRSCQDLK